MIYIIVFNPAQGLSYILNQFSSLCSRRFDKTSNAIQQNNARTHTVTDLEEPDVVRLNEQPRADVVDDRRVQRVELVADVDVMAYDQRHVNVHRNGVVAHCRHENIQSPSISTCKNKLYDTG